MVLGSRSKKFYNFPTRALHADCTTFPDDNIHKILRILYLRDSGLAGDELENFRESMLEAHSLGRLGKADDIAKAILFLASDDSAWTTGTNFLIDGGRALTMK